MKKKGMAFALIFTFLVCAVPMNTKADIKELPAAQYCSVMIPESFKVTDVAGMYVNEHYPLESANISYGVKILPEDRVLTNAQKAAGESESVSDVDIRYDELTEEMYEEIMKENYEDLYGDGIGYTIESFENIQKDGFPGYHIVSSFTPEGSQMIHQEAFIILSQNKVFTVAYSRAEDDDFTEEFAQSIDSIHVIRKNS
ncbi:hypothetical protein [Butyrivibrio sp. WCD3002]|uniref:hypothetical protein n=1 Tax=Butyrivibrio sp. WCD3002 TaxID=1280676 RepID=UPI0004225F62|nr:hypothetical protein [Butyrivibrio sp. WCD3002]